MVTLVQNSLVCLLPIGYVPVCAVMFDLAVELTGAVTILAALTWYIRRYCKKPEVHCQLRSVCCSNKITHTSN